MLKNKIQQDIIQFMKEKNKFATMILRTLVSEIKNEEIKMKRELSEQEGIAIVSRLVKQYNESIKEIEKSTNEELKAVSIKEVKEKIDLLMIYLPKQLTEQEVKSFISKIIIENNIQKTEKGKLMKLIMPELKGKFDGSKINSFVQELL